MRLNMEILFQIWDFIIEIEPFQFEITEYLN